MSVFACYSCEAEAERGRKVKYCSHLCRVLFRYAVNGKCLVCGERPAGWDERTRLLLSGEIPQVKEAFAHAHRSCRREFLDEVGRDEKLPRSQRSSRRPTRHRKHLTAILLRDDWACQICGLRVEFEAPSWDERAPQLDHIVPVSAGGTDDLENLRLVHRWCNAMKSDVLYATDQRIAEAARVRFADAD